MAPIDPIYNGEGGASVRAKLNELIDTVNSGSTTINVGDAPLYDPLKAGGYEAGSIISYKNESSPDPEFQEFAIYLALDDISQGVGPEDSADWKNEGATMEVAGGNTANGVVQNIDRLRELTGMRTGHTVAVQAEGAIYVFDEGSESGIKPFAPGIGSWVKRYEFSEMGGGHTFEDQSGTALPARSIAKAGAGIEFEDDDVNEMTVVRVDEAILKGFEETLIFRDLETFEFTKSQSFKITQVVSESGVTASIKIHGTETDYVINDTVSAFDRLDISVDILGAITIKGILV
jgi:hypothetical protein